MGMTDMVDKKLVLCVVLTIGLLLSNGLWFLNDQQLQIDKQDLKAQIGQISSTKEVLATQYSTLLEQHDLLNDQISSLQITLNSSSDNLSSISILYENLTEQNSMLESNYSSLTCSFLILQGQFNNLSKQYTTLDGQNNLTHSQYTTLQDQYNSLNSQYSTLQCQYNSYKLNYTNLRISYNCLLNQSSYLSLVKMGSLAHDYYETLRSEYSPSWWDTPNIWAGFYAYLSKHDRAAGYWTDIDDLYYSHYGTHRYLEAKSILTSVLKIAGTDHANSDVDKISSILSFINTHIQYQSDLIDRPFAPTETLSSGTGDCEDYSILASALFEMEGVQTAIAIFHNSTEGHAMVLVQLADLGSWSGYDTSNIIDGASHGLAAGQWIIIDPQLTISHQSNAGWSASGERWTIDAAAET
jgi:hypothetical protein